MNNKSYGDGCSFARFKRSPPSNYALEVKNRKILDSQSSLSDYKTKLPTHSSRDQRNSIQTLNKTSIEDYYNAPLHTKTNSHANLLPSSLSKSMAVDDFNDYKNVQFEGAMKTIEQKPLSTINLKSDKAPSVIDKLKIINENNKLENRDESLHTISYDKEIVIPSPNKQINSMSPKIASVNQMKTSSSGKLLDSLDKYMDANETMYGESREQKLINLTKREDVQRNSIEQDRYKNRLNQMNSKQLMIFEKYLSDQLIPTKDKEKQLEEIERIKREEAKSRLDALDQNSVINQKALK